jgi:hypothetical protein
LLNEDTKYMCGVVVHYSNNKTDKDVFPPWHQARTLIKWCVGVMDFRNSIVAQYCLVNRSLAIHTSCSEDGGSA